jgi:hypothetical protein
MKESLQDRLIKVALITKVNACITFVSHIIQYFHSLKVLVGFVRLYVTNNVIGICISGNYAHKQIISLLNYSFMAGFADPLPKTVSYIFIKHNRQTKIQNNTNTMIN